MLRFHDRSNVLSTKKNLIFVQKLFETDIKRHILLQICIVQVLPFSVRALKRRAQQRGPACRPASRRARSSGEWADPDHSVEVPVRSAARCSSVTCVTQAIRSREKLATRMPCHCRLPVASVTGFSGWLSPHPSPVPPLLKHICQSDNLALVDCCLKRSYQESSCCIIKKAGALICITYVKQTSRLNP